MSPRLDIGPVSLDLDCFIACVNGRRPTLTRLEFDILAYLMSNAHRVVCAEELVERVGKNVYRTNTSWVRVHISHLRRKLGPEARVIETIRGRGLRFLQPA